MRELSARSRSEVRAEPLRGAGRPLEPATRRFMESRLQHDFASVRVHAEGEPAALADRLGAAAFARGPEIAFAPGFYAPATLRGLRLIAHELVHVAQQDGLDAAAEDATSAEAAEAPAHDAAAHLLSSPTRAFGAARPVGIAMEPRSLVQTLNPAQLSDDELNAEIDEIRAWVRTHAADPSADALAGALDNLAREAVRRHPEIAPPRISGPPAPPPAAAGVSAADVNRANLAAPLLAVGLTAGVPLSASPPPGVLFPPAAPPVVAPPVAAPPVAAPPVVAPPVPAPPVVPEPPVGIRPTPAMAGGSVLAGIAAFLVVFLWPNESIMSGAEERRLLEEAQRAAPQPGPQPAPQPAPQPGPPDNDRRDECRAGFTDYVPVDCDGLTEQQVVETARAGTRYAGPRYRAGNRRRIGYIDRADDCGGGPAPIFHYDIFDRTQRGGDPVDRDVISVFACTCCSRTGATGTAFRAHISGGR